MHEEKGQGTFSVLPPSFLSPPTPVHLKHCSSQGRKEAEKDGGKITRKARQVQISEVKQDFRIPGPFLGKRAHPVA